MRKLILIFLCLFFTIFSFSQEVKISSEKTNINGKKYYLHTVEDNQTLYSISKAYRVSVDEILGSNKNLTNSIKKGQSILIPYKKVEDLPTSSYTVKPGDTKYSLSKKYNISVADFNKINPKLAKTDDLKVGSIVKLPNYAETAQSNSNSSENEKFYFHTVIKGETLSSLSRKYNVSHDDIVKNNEIENSTIKIGEIIKIPKTGTVINNTENSDTKHNIIAACDSINWYSNKDKIVVSVLLPFDKNSNLKKFNESSNSKQLQKIGTLSADMCSFYFGCLVALDNFAKYNNRIVVNTYDIGKDNTVIEKLFNENKFSDNTFIIGPAYASQIEFLNEKLVNNNKNVQLILPFVNNVEILRKYPNNTLITPVSYQVKRAITKYLHTKDSTNIIIVHDNNQESLNDADKMNRQLVKDSLKNHKITILKSANLSEIKKLLKEDYNNIVINYIRSEALSNELFSKLYSVLDYKIMVIGEKDILYSDNIDLLYFQKLKYTYFSHQNIDYEKEDVKLFIDKYRKIFVNEPNAFSFDGYDAMNFHLDMRLKYGDKCYKCLSDTYSVNGLSGENQYINSSKYFENSYVNRSVFLFELQEDFTTKLVYPISEKE